MLIRLGYDIEFNIPQPVAVVALLNVHPSREADLREPDQLRIEPTAGTQQYIDHFGNRLYPLSGFSRQASPLEFHPH
jgi:hypothetical protein